MITLLYHARTNGAVCRKIAEASRGQIYDLCDTEVDVPGRRPGILIRWDSRVEQGAERTINSAEAVRFSRNKRASRQLLADAGLAPATWVKRGLCQYPCVVRPRRHFGGHGFHLCRNQQELDMAIRACGGPRRWYASQFIAKTHEYRVFVLNDKVFKVTRRYTDTNDPTVPWNCQAGAHVARIMEAHWPPEVVKKALTAAKLLDLQFCAVDVMVAPGGAYVLEANTAPGLERASTIKGIAKRFSELT